MALGGYVCKLILRKQLDFAQTPIRKFRGIKGKTYGKPPGEARTIKQILEGLNYKDPSLYYKVDIGLPPTERPSHKDLMKQIKGIKAKRANEKGEVTLEEIREQWEKSIGPYHTQKAADYYGVFDHLFGDAYFTPYRTLSIAYKLQDEQYMPVYSGNLIKPREACEAPLVEFDAKPNMLYTLILSTPDGHLKQEAGEYVHWFVGNIKDGEVKKGEQVKSYMQPFPTRGTGYHRLVYVLYEHEQPIDFSAYKTPKSDQTDLDDRTFCTYDFYRSRQEDVTPAGLAFFQTDWDSSVSDFFHKCLNIEEPVFEYDAPKHFVNKQEWFPKKQPFNTYLDRYSDPKKVARNLLLKKLKTHHPFKKPDPPLKYPNLHVYTDTQDMPSWLRVELKKESLGWGIMNQHRDMLDPE